MDAIKAISNYKKVLRVKFPFLLFFSLQWRPRYFSSSAIMLVLDTSGALSWEGSIKGDETK